MIGACSSADAISLLDHMRRLAIASDVGGMQDTLQNGDVSLLLQMVIENCSEPEWQQICENSYRHANGFARITLPFLLDTQCRARLHIWDVESNDTARDMHNHRWYFASRVLHGALENQTFKVDRDGEFTHYVHTASDDVSYSLASAGSASLSLDSIDTHRAGDAYSMPPPLVHDILAIGNGTSTFVIEFPFVRSHTDIFSRWPKETATPIRRTRFRQHEIKDAIAGLLYKGI